MNVANKKILNKLYEMAQTVEPVSRSRVVAAIARKKKICSIGINSFNSSALARKFSCDNKHKVFNHAEISAISNYIKIYSIADLKKCTLFIVRAKYDNSGNWITGLAKPCKGCNRAIEFFNFKNVIWTKEGELG